MQETAHILVLNGPNLNLLGSREPEVYGTETLSTMMKRLEGLGRQHSCRITHHQSNAEHELIDIIHAAESVDFVIINPAAYTHTSIAIRDALLGMDIPFIEVHLSNVHAREPFRRHSYFSDRAEAVICGLGSTGYDVAFHGALSYLKNQKTK